MTDVPNVMNDAKDMIHNLQHGLKNFFKIIWIGISSITCIDLFSFRFIIGTITSWRDQYKPVTLLSLEIL